jgi:hypothetical protein
MAALFASVIFRVGSWIFAWGWRQTEILLPTPVLLGLQTHNTMPSLLVEMWVSLTFCLAWAQTVLLQIAGIIGVCHCAQPPFYLFIG